MTKNEYIAELLNTLIACPVLINYVPDSEQLSYVTFEEIWFLFLGRKQFGGVKAVI